MKFSAAALVLATLAVESASAASVRHVHKHAHEKKDSIKARDVWVPPAGYDYHTDPAYLATASAAPAAPEPTGSSSTTTTGNSNIPVQEHAADWPCGGGAGGQVSVLAGTQNGDTSNNGFVWKGESGGENTLTVKNAGADAKLVFANKNSIGPDGAPLGLGAAQWVAKYAPALNFDIKAGESMTFQLATGASGVFFPVREEMGTNQCGLIRTTLGEFTIAGSDTTFDVSRLWHVEAVDLEIGSDNDCITSTKGDTCAFVCTEIEYDQTCGAKNTYDLVNRNKSDKCHLGFRDGQPEGGCYVTQKVQATFW